MSHRIVVRLSTIALAALIAGCSEDLPSEPNETVLQVTPLFTGIAEGDSIQLTATIDGEPVDVTWTSGDESVVSVSEDGWVVGNTGGFAPVTATTTTGPERTRSASITVIPIPELESGVPETSISSSGARGSGSFFKIDVPAGASNLTIELSGGTGDVDLYVRHGTRPTSSVADCWSFNAGNTESCSIDNPDAGMWYILLDLWDPYSGVTLTATVTP